MPSAALDDLGNSGSRWRLGRDRLGGDSRQDPLEKSGGGSQCHYLVYVHEKGDFLKPGVLSADSGQRVMIQNRRGSRH